MILMNLQQITLAIGGPPLLDGISLQINDGEKICLLGRNGSGKTTLMKIINRDIEPDSGRLICGGNLKTALLTQEIPEDMTGSVYSIIAGGIASPEEFTHHLDSYEEQEKRSHIEKILSLLTLDPSKDFESLSAGMKRRVLLGRALVREPDILLLDEPTNHLDIYAIEWLEDFLSRYEKTVFLVTHDRMFLQKTAKRIIELDRGTLADWQCDYRTFLQRKDALLEAEEAQREVFDKKLAKEEAWIRRGVKARRTRNEGRVKALLKMREERKVRREQAGNVRMTIQQTEKSGKLVLEATDISFGYNDTNIIENLTTTILRGDRVGIIGPNGCGKSTLIKLLTMELSPKKGSVKPGVRIEAAYFDQLRNQLDENETVRENVSDGNDIIDFNGKQKHVIGYLEDFLFSPDRAAVKVKVLSGGEKNRLLLAKLFARPANLLILDEPTNDLDLETVELLEELLIEFEGTILLVSHDREFLNNVVTSTLAFEGQGAVSECVGGYDEWISRRSNNLRSPENEVSISKKARERKPADKKKLTFREKKELESIPHILEDKENRRKELVNMMSDPSLYKDRGETVSGIKEELRRIEEELEALYHRWQELEEKE